MSAPPPTPPDLLALLMQVPAAIALQRGPELRYELVNPVYAKLLAGRAAVGKTLAEVLPDWAQIRRILDGVMRTGQPYSARARQFFVDRFGDGVIREAYFDLVCQPLRRPDGTIDGVVTFGVEVTDQVEARQRLEALTAELRRAVEVRDRFLSVASHELKTPLTALRLHLQSMLRSLDRESLPATASPKREWWRRRLRSADRQVEHLVWLIEQLLDVSRIRERRFVVRSKSLTDLTELAREMVEANQPAATAVGSSLELLPSPSVSGHWARLRLEQVLANLLSNAIRFGAGKAITVAVARVGGWAELSVEDHGIGVAPADQERIFEQFERAVTDRQYGGLGLGLWVSRQVARSLGGDVTLWSELGVGSRFTLRLPLDEPSPPADDQHAER